METANLTTADKGSYYTILGAGGDLNDWTTGVTECLVEREIGTPTAFYSTTGKAINEYAATKGEVVDPFPDDLTVLMFPLDGLNGPKLAVFKMNAGDRWFDDIVTNMVDDPDDEDDEDEDELEDDEDELEECEHGLRADLCGGPMHWYDETNR